jgi:hypothetical protein
LYACDLAWWNGKSGQKALREFKGEKWTQCPDAAKQYGLHWIESRRGEGIGRGFVYTGGGNSGYQALNLALQWGSPDVILCGFTMGAAEHYKNVHWHPDHQGNNPTVTQLCEWGKILGKMTEYAHGKIRMHGESSVTAFPQTELVPQCSGVIGVARSGGWVTNEYPERLYKDTGALILTDMDLPFDTMPLAYSWPGWWAKMEIFRPEIRGDWLYMDMDTMVIGDIEPLKAVRKLALLGDYYADKLETGVMYLPEWARRVIWRRWINSPEKWMQQYRGDGDFIRDTIGTLAVDLRKEVTGLHSYKVDGPQPDTRLLIYHGQPRPHETEIWHTKRK